MAEVQVKVVFFAKSRELVHKIQDYLTLPIHTDAILLKAKIISAFPSLEPIADNIVLAVNQEYIEENGEELHLAEGDEVAVIPPISECAATMTDFIKVTEEKLSVDEITELVTSPTSGAVSLFIGTTRNNFNGRKVLHLEYEAHIPMAESEMKKICSRLRDTWPDIEHIAMFHRIGHVPVTEASVIIAVSSPHRKESLAAVNDAIDTLKAQVPVWKKEFYEDGESDWKENKECCWKS